MRIDSTQRAKRQYTPPALQKIERVSETLASFSTLIGGVQMAKTNMYLKLHEINGKSVDEDHKDWIELISFTWVVHADATFEVGLGGQAKQSHIDAISASKFCDKSSVTLWKNCTTGKHIPRGHIHCLKLDGDTRVKYLTLELEDIMLRKVSWSGAGDDSVLKEDIELVFAKFKETYTVQHDLGGSGAGLEFGYNIQSARAS